MEINNPDDKTPTKESEKEHENVGSGKDSDVFQVSPETTDIATEVSNVSLETTDIEIKVNEGENGLESASKDINSISELKNTEQSTSVVGAGNVEGEDANLPSSLGQMTEHASSSKDVESKTSSKLDIKDVLPNGSAIPVGDDSPKQDDISSSLPLSLQSSKEHFDYIQRYNPGSTLQHGTRSQLQRVLRRYGFHCINISVFGFPNSGKSAFINTVNYAISSSPGSNYEEVCGERKVECSDITSLTNKRQFVAVIEEIGLIDNKGVEDFNSKTLNEISRQCEGYRGKDDFIPDDWNHGVSTKLKDYLKYWCTGKVTRINDRVHCPIIIYSLASENEPESLTPLIQLFQRTCGSPPVIVMTHFDSVKDKAELLQERKRQFQNLHCARMFCIENYTHTSHKRKEETDKVVAEIISASCLVSDQYLVETLLRSNGSKCC